jgi:trimeric autotransporter adhesin
MRSPGFRYSGRYVLRVSYMTRIAARTALASAVLLSAHLAWPQSTLMLSSATATAGTPAVLDLSLSSAADSQPAAIQWRAVVPAGVSGFSIAAGPALSAAGKSLTCVASGSTYNCIAYGVNSNVIADGVVATFTVTCAGAGSASIGVTGALEASANGAAIVTTAGGGTVTTAANVLTLASITCPASLNAGASGTCTVTATGQSSVSTSVALGASDALSAPATVSINPNASSATFTVTAKNVAISQPGTVTATLNSVSKTANLTVNAVAAALSSLQCGATSLPSSGSTTCTATLAGAAPIGGVTVALASGDRAALSVPGSILIPAGSTSAVFTASAGAVKTAQNVTLTATLNGGSKSLVLAIGAPGGVTVTGLNCGATTLTPGMVSSCTIALSGPAPSGGSRVVMSAAASVPVILPVSVRVAAGASAAAFDMKAGTITSVATANIMAVLGTSSVSQSISFSPEPYALAQLVCSPLMVLPGGSGTCRAVLTAPRSANSVVYLSATDSSLMIPGTVTIPAGALSASVAFTTPAAFSTPATISALYGRIVKSATVLPGAAGPLSSSVMLSCSERHVPAGGSTVCEISSETGSGSAAVFWVTSNSARLRIPIQVRLGYGGRRVRFQVDADPQGPEENVTLQAASAEASAETSLAVLSSGRPIFRAASPLSREGSPEVLLVLHDAGIAALPRYDAEATPAAAGETLRVYAKGIACSEPLALPPALYFDGRYQAVDRMTPGSLEGVCELTAAVPEGIAGDSVELSVEVVRQDGSRVRSRNVGMAIERR